MEQNQIDPLANNNATQPMQEVPKLKSKKAISLIFAIIFGILFAGAVGFIVWQNYFSKEKTTQSNVNAAQTSTMSNASTTIAAIDTHPITSSIISKILTKYNLVSNNDMTKQQATDVSIKQSNRAPFWQIEGTDRYVDYTDQNASSLEISIPIVNNEYTVPYNEIGGYVLSSFATDGLNKITTDTSNMYSYGIYSKDDITCSTNYTNDGSTSSIILVGCGQKSKYTTNLASYIIAKPFFDAAGSTANYISIENMVVQSGQNGYVNTQLSFSNGAQLFYKAPNGQWVYFKGTQAVLNCSDFNTSDLKSAFAYNLCSDGQNNTLSTVSKYYNL